MDLTSFYSLQTLDEGLSLFFNEARSALGFDHDFFYIFSTTSCQIFLHAHALHRLLFLEFEILLSIKFKLLRSNTDTDGIS